VYEELFRLLVIRVLCRYREKIM